MFGSALGKVGQGATQTLSVITGTLGILALTLRKIPELAVPGRRDLFWLLFKRQLYNSGFRAATINTLIAVLLGWLVMSRAYSVLPSGVKFVDYYAQFFVIVIVREIGPFISGMILIIRSASAVTAEIAQLKLFKQFEALSAQYMSGDLLFLLPVFFAFPISLLLMFFYFNVICVISAYVLITTFHHVDLGFNAFLIALLNNISSTEIVISISKAWFGGILIGLLSIHFGTSVADRLTDISRTISNSNTAQLLAFFLVNIIFSYFAYR